MKTCSTCQRCYDDSSRFCEDDNHNLIHARPGNREILDKYRLNFLLHRDSVGETYQASDVSADKTVIVRFISPDVGSSGQGLHESFLNEAWAAAEIEHPNVIRVYESSVLGGSEIYTVTEAVDGQTLREYRRQKGSLPVSEAVLIIRQLTNALKTVHNAGIIHSAVNPANIFITFDEDRQILAKIGNFDFAGLTENAVAVGDEPVDIYQQWRLECLQYLSPEQCAGENVDGRSDIYSLGVVLYELLSGHPPFEANTAKDLLEKQINEQPQPVEHLPFDVSKFLNPALMQVLEKNPSMRLSTTHFASQLQDIERLAPQPPLEEILLSSTTEEVEPVQNKIPALSTAFNLFTAEKPQESQLAEETANVVYAPVKLSAVSESFLSNINEEQINADETGNLSHKTEDIEFADLEVIVLETDTKEDNASFEFEQSVSFAGDVDLISSDTEETETVPSSHSIQQVLHRLSSAHFTRIAVSLAVLTALVIAGALFSAWQSQQQSTETAGVIAAPVSEPETPVTPVKQEEVIADTVKQEEAITDDNTANSDALPPLTVQRTPQTIALNNAEEVPEVKRQVIKSEENLSGKKKTKDAIDSLPIFSMKRKEMFNALESGVNKPRVVIRNVNHPNLVYEVRNPNYYQTRQCKMEVSQRQLSVVRNGGTASLPVTFENAADAENLTVTTDSPAHISTALQPNKNTNRRTVRITSTSEITKTYTVFIKSPCGMQAVKVQVR